MKKPSFGLNAIFGIVTPVFLAVVVALISPPEKTLGNIAKFIYFHGALSWTGIATYTLAGFLGVLFLLLRKREVFAWADAFQKTAISLWFAHSVIGMVSMQIAWGGIFWQEPRFLTATLILLITVALYTAARAIGKPWLSSVLYLAAAATTWGLLLNSGRVFHPTNPIMGGQSLSIKIYAAAITALLMIAAYNIAAGFKKRA
jgi:uncharacterized membrane protein